MQLVCPHSPAALARSRRLIFGLLLLATAALHAQNNPYRLSTLHTMEAYRQAVAKDSRQELVSLQKAIPGIQLDIRYATDSNIMHHPVYQRKEAFLRRPAAEALKDIQTELRPLGYALKIFDAYRPYQVTVAFWEAYHDSNFVASPYTGSRHNRGCAVDLTIIDGHTGQELSMPTPYDSFTPKAAANYMTLPAAALKNRKLLQDVMLRHGFTILSTEWWHFDYAGWRDYPITDLSFEQLDQDRHDH